MRQLRTALALSFLSVCLTARADDLASRNLAPVDSLSEGLGHATPAADPISGSFDGAKAATSVEREMEFDVTYRGFANAEIRAQVVHSDRRNVPNVACASVTVSTAAATPAHLSLKCSLEAATPEG